MDSSGLLQDSTPPTGRFRPYASTKHRVTRGRYITSNDPRGYIPVYEYPLNGQYIMMDIDDGYILWTGIWKALGNAKADIVKMLESQPDLAPQLRRVRGGYLKIQGTWMPYEVALRLARRVAWTIREDLIPLFGPTFPTTCLSPDQPGYGQILGAQQGRRRGRRSAMALPTAPASSQQPVASGSNMALHQGGVAQGTVTSGLSLLSAAAAGENRLDQRPRIPFAAASGASSARHMDYHQQAGDWDGSHWHGASAYPGSPTVDVHRASGMTRPHATSPATPHEVSDVSMGPPPLPGYSRAHAAYSTLSTSPKTIPRSREHEGHSGLGRHPSSSSLDSRFSPYPTFGRRRSSSTASGTLPVASRPSPVDLPPLTIPPPLSSSRQGTGIGANFNDVRSKLTTSHFSASASGPSSTSLNDPLGPVISLPPIKEPSTASDVVSFPSFAQFRSGSMQSTGSGSGVMLPPISSLDEPPSSLSSNSPPGHFDSSAVLRRLRLDDEMLGRARFRLSESVDTADDLSSNAYNKYEALEHRQPTLEQLMIRRRSTSAPPPHPDYFARRIDQGLSSSSPHPFVRPRTSPVIKSESPAGSSLDTYRSQGRGARMSKSITRDPLAPFAPSRSLYESREACRARSPPSTVLSPGPESQHHRRPVSSSSSHSRSRANDDRRDGMKGESLDPYFQHETQKCDASSRSDSIHSQTPPGASSSQTYAGRSSQPDTQGPLPSPTYNADLASYRFGQRAESVRHSSPVYRSKEIANLDMEIDPELPTGFHSSEVERRERIRPW